MKAAGYIRVSSKVQIEGESLEDQRKSIKAYVKNQNWKLIEIYSDEGISGKDMKKREGLKRLLKDAKDKKFDVVLIRRVTRFGRSTEDTIRNMRILKDLNVKLISLAENIDFDSSMGKMMFTILAGFAELENDVRIEQIMTGKIGRAEKGHPMGKWPYARSYDKVTEKWTLDEKKADKIRKVVEDFLNGKPLATIAEEQRMDQSNMTGILDRRLGSDWEVYFKGTDQTIKYTVPPIIEDESIIQAVKRKLALQKKGFKRSDITKYSLNGFIRCAGCHAALVGQTQRDRWSYYRHKHYYTVNEKADCHAITYIPVDVIEKAVFATIFENTKDEVGFERAIQDTFPNPEEIKKLKAKIVEDEKDLKKINKDIDKLIDLALKKVLSDETIRARETELLKTKEVLLDNIEANKAKLSNFPEPELLKKEARIMRRQMELYFRSQERLQAMSYSEKRKLLHWLFPDGEDEEGSPYGVFVEKVGKGVYDYFINARLFAGSRFLKGADIDYWDEELDTLVDKRIQGYITSSDSRDH